MKIWQADFYKLDPRSQPHAADTQWLLLVCDEDGAIVVEAQCPQFQAKADWIAQQLEPRIGNVPPDLIQCFRPQSLGPISAAVERWGIACQGTRRTTALKLLLQERADRGQPCPMALEQSPPQPLPDDLLGERWQLGALSAGDLVDFFGDRPIPFCEMPDNLLPVRQGIASNAAIPGVIIYGGRRSMALAGWLADAHPYSLNYIPQAAGESGGLVLESGLSDRWILATFEDSEMAEAAETYERRKQQAAGLHFLLVRPDDSGRTESGFWLLKAGD